eukprot:Rmarinus@m.15288
MDFVVVSEDNSESWSVISSGSATSERWSVVSEDETFSVDETDETINIPDEAAVVPHEPITSLSQGHLLVHTYRRLINEDITDVPSFPSVAAVQAPSCQTAIACTNKSGNHSLKGKLSARRAPQRGYAKQTTRCTHRTSCSNKRKC